MSTYHELMITVDFGLSEEDTKQALGLLIDTGAKNIDPKIVYERFPDIGTEFSEVNIWSMPPPPRTKIIPDQDRLSLSTLRERKAFLLWRRSCNRSARRRRLRKQYLRGVKK